MYEVISLPFKASTFSCLPFPYAFLRFLILKREEDVFEQMVEVDREFMNQAAQAVRKAAGPFPSGRPADEQKHLGISSEPASVLATR